MKNNIIIGLILAVVILLAIVIRQNEPKPEKDITLKPDEKVKVVMRDNRLQAVSKAGSGEVYIIGRKVSPRADLSVTVKDNGTISAQINDFSVLPLHLSVSYRFMPVGVIGFNVALIRAWEYYLSAGVDNLGISISADRDLFDILPVKNTYVGIFATQNYGGYTSFGLHIGVFL